MNSIKSRILDEPLKNLLFFLFVLQIASLTSFAEQSKLAATNYNGCLSTEANISCHEVCMHARKLGVHFRSACQTKNSKLNEHCEELRIQIGDAMRISFACAGIYGNERFRSKASAACEIGRQAKTGTTSQEILKMVIDEIPELARERVNLPGITIESSMVIPGHKAVTFDWEDLSWVGMSDDGAAILPGAPATSATTSTAEPPLTPSNSNVENSGIVDLGIPKEIVAQCKTEIKKLRPTLIEIGKPYDAYATENRNILDKYGYRQAYWNWPLSDLSLKRQCDNELIAWSQLNNKPIEFSSRVSRSENGLLTLEANPKTYPGFYFDSGSTDRTYSEPIFYLGAIEDNRWIESPACVKLKALLEADLVDLGRAVRAANEMTSAKKKYLAGEQIRKIPETSLARDFYFVMRQKYRASKSAAALSAAIKQELLKEESGGYPDPKLFKSSEGIMPSLIENLDMARSIDLALNRVEIETYLDANSCEKANQTLLSFERDSTQNRERGTQRFSLATSIDDEALFLAYIHRPQTGEINANLGTLSTKLKGLEIEMRALSSRKELAERVIASESAQIESIRADLPDPYCKGIVLELRDELIFEEFVSGLRTEPSKIIEQHLLNFSDRLAKLKQKCMDLTVERSTVSDRINRILSSDTTPSELKRKLESGGAKPGF